jgi:hypothetical protein
MLNQFPRNSRHVSRLPCEDVPIFLEEFDKREFLFRIQIIANVSILRRLLRRQWNRLAECVLRLDGRLGGPGLGHDRVSFHPNMVRAHLFISRPAGGVLKHLFQEFHQMLRSNLVAGLPSWVLDPAVLPA